MQTSAAIDIGSNTIRVVVAHGSPDTLEVLATDEALVRIGESVNATGQISAQKRTDTLTVLRRHLALAAQYDAAPVLAIATEAIRKATDRDDFIAQIQHETGLTVQIIAGDVEAVLTFYGATYGLHHIPDAPTHVAVMDLGGGSTELVLAEQMHMTWHTSLAIGSGQIHDRFLMNDPPTAEDLSVARTFLDTYFAGLAIKHVPSTLLATGGTANSLLLLAQRAFGLDPSQHYLTPDDLVRCEGLLAALPATEIAQRYQIEAKRARILLAGTLIIHAFSDQFQLTKIMVSTNGIREGVLIAYARYGDQWLEQAGHEATAAPIPAPIAKQEETFAHYGRRLLHERARAMLDWPKEVLRHEDIEAVHKMRVASRRLRATLDAYESICDPRLFKEVYRQTKQTADLLGVARDTDVMIDRLRHQLEDTSADEERAGLTWLIKRLSDYRQEHQQELERFLKQFPEGSFLRKIDACIPEGGHNDGQS